MNETPRARFLKAFPRGKAFLPVIHIRDTAQALRNAAIAADNGADGIFLIHHGGHHLETCRVYAAVRKEYPDLWIGVNFLDLGIYPAQETAISHGITDGLWVDNAGFHEGRLARECAREADRVAALRRDRKWPGLYFGGVAFKYQGEVRDPAALAREATRAVDVITTSGAGTGFAPDLGKLIAIRAAIKDHPSANASGTTLENIRSFLPHTDALLVASGISDDEHELNPGRVRAMSDIARSFGG